MSNGTHSRSFEALRKHHFSCDVNCFRELQEYENKQYNHEWKSNAPGSIYQMKLYINIKMLLSQRIQKRTCSWQFSVSSKAMISKFVPYSVHYLSMQKLKLTSDTHWSRWKVVFECAIAYWSCGQQFYVMTYHYRCRAAHLVEEQRLNSK